MASTDCSGPKDLIQSGGRKVRALYDFEAAEENELTFSAGDILFVRDDSDVNWWTGYNDRGEGLFPSNFVTADLNAEVDIKNLIRGSKDMPKQEAKFMVDVINIDEEKINRLLHLIHEANPEDPTKVVNLYHLSEKCLSWPSTQLKFQNLLHQKYLI